MSWTGSETLRGCWDHGNVSDDASDSYCIYWPYRLSTTDSLQLLSKWPHVFAFLGSHGEDGIQLVMFHRTIWSDRFGLGILDPCSSGWLINPLLHNAPWSHHTWLIPVHGSHMSSGVQSYFDSNTNDFPLLPGRVKVPRCGWMLRHFRRICRHHLQTSLDRNADDVFHYVRHLTWCTTN